MIRRISIPCSRKQHGGGGANLKTRSEEILDREECVKNNNICFSVWRTL